MAIKEPKTKVAYILSMAKRGIPAFTYREIEILMDSGIEISIFPLKYRPGPYMPKPEWYCYVYSTLLAMLRQPLHFLRRPVKYIKLLALSIRTRTIAEFAIAMDFAEKMRKRGIERIHCHFGDRKLFVGYYVNQLLGLPLTVTVHGYEIYKHRSPRMFKLAVAACEFVVVQSDFNAERLVTDLCIPKDKLRLVRAHGDIHNPVEERAVKLLVVAEFREKKGYDVLFEALKKLQRDDWVLWVVGEGELNVPAMASRAGIERKVRFFGMLPGNLLDILYSTCDVFVLPSKTTADGDREGIPAVLMEAMSHAKPVISTRHAGIPELVSEILVEEKDPDAFAKSIEKLIADPELRRTMGLRNREIVRSKYSKQNVVDLGERFIGQRGEQGRPAEPLINEIDGNDLMDKGDLT